MTPSASSQDEVQSARPFLLVWFVFSLAVLAGAKFLLFPSGLAERMDFRQLYAAGYQARTDPASLYDYEQQKAVQDRLVGKAGGLLPFIRPAYEALLFLPLSYLPYRAAYLGFLALNLLSLLGSFFACRCELSHAGTFAQPRAGLQIFLFYPVLAAILQGQDSILMLLGFCLAYRCWKHGAGFPAGVLLGLMMFKPQITIPLAAFWLVRYASLAFSGGLAVGIAGSAALSIYVSGWSAVLSFGRVLKLTTAATLAPNSGPVLGVAPTAMPNLKGLISGMTLNRLPASATLLITLVASVGIAIAVMRSLRTSKPSAEVAFSVALTAALLLSYYLHLQDFALLLLPLGFLAGQRKRNLALASWLLYIAPPLVVMLGHGLIFLLSLPVLFLLLVASGPADCGPGLRARSTASA